jgi:hypothetical protein
MSTDSRACDMYPPSSISAETLTHGNEIRNRSVVGQVTNHVSVNYAFALISEEFQIMEMAVNDNVLVRRTSWR